MAQPPSDTPVPLRVLLVEDSALDAELVTRALGEAGYAVTASRVETAEALDQALASPPDLIVSDYALPQFDGFSALDLVRDRGLDVPFILVSGALGEEAAVGAIKRGVDDYLLKTNLARIGPAVHQALEGRQLRREHRRDQEQLEQLADELRASDATHRLLFESNPQPCWVYDLETLRFLAVNDAAVARYGYSRDEFLAMTIAEIRPAEDVSRLRQAVTGVTRGIDRAGVWRHRLKGGGEILVEISSHVLDYGGRRAELVLAVDVTDRERVEAELLSARQRIQAILDAVPSGIHGLDLEGRIVFENPAAAAMFGWPPNEMVGRTGHELIHHHRAGGEPYPRAECPICQTLLDGEVRRVDDEVFFRRDGTAFPVEYVCAPLRDASGATTGAVVSFLDISARRAFERERTELLAREQAARREADVASGYYRSLFEHAPGCYLVLTADDYQIAGVSEAYLQATMTTRDQLRGQRLFDVFPDPPDEPNADGVATLRASLDRVRQSGQSDVMAVQRYPVRHPDGRWEERFWSPVNTPVPGPDGQTAFIIHRIEDVTEYVRLKRRPGEAGGPDPLATRASQLEADILLRSLELKRANDQLAESQRRASELAARLTTTLESLTDAFYALDAEWRFVYVNAEGERLLQRSRDELVGRVVWDEFPEAVDSTFQREYERAMRTGVPVVFEELYRPLRTWFEVRAYPSSEGLAVYFRDIGVVRTAREALKTSEERFRLLAQATNDAIWDWDMRADTLWWSDGFATQFGFDLAATTPSVAVWASHIHPDDREATEARVFGAIERGEDQWANEYRFRRADGTWAYVLDRGRAIRDAEGRPIRATGGMTDISDRKRIENRLREQAALLDRAQDAILVRDLEHTILYWNRSAEQLYGWSAEEAVGRSLIELLHADTAAYAAATAACLADGEWNGEVTKVARDGRHVIVEARWTLVRDDAGAPTSILAINTDITERKRLEQQFLRAQRMESIGTLAGGIAHDLNNVLSPILMSIGLLQMDERDPVKLEMLATIEQSARRGADMVSQVLSFARGLEGRRMEVQVRHLVRDVAKIVAETFPKDIEIRPQVAADTWLLQADPTQLHQVLLNLCVNARDAMPSGGRITISAENLLIDAQYAAMILDARPGPYVKVEVEDTGTGIPPEIVEKVFDPFFTTKEPGKGTGLGLSTTLAIVKSHGGFIRVYSDPGIGTRFRIYLPARQEVGPEADDADRVVLARGHGELVLVVDDEASIRQITKQTLEAFGYRVLLAADGAEAISAFVQHQRDIAVVLTDMVMPVMDGPATIQVLLRLDPAARIIAASGIAANGKVAQAASAGVTRFLPKPYTAETLLTAIRKAIDGES